MTTKTIQITDDPNALLYLDDGSLRTTNSPGGASTIGDGADVAEGATTAAAASSSVAEDATARTGIGLFKGIKNILILIYNKLATPGTGFSIPVTLTVTNGAYTIGDVVGGLISFANAVSAAGKKALIETITLAGVAALDYELWFFASDIATPALDNAVFTLVAADVAMCKGVIPIAASDYKAPASAFNVATLRNVGFYFTCTATTLYAYLKAIATTTPGTTTLTLTIRGKFID